MIIQGDCLEVMRTLADNSVDAVVTDPPYALNFMGKKWDADVPSVAVWTEVLRILKPGGHVLSFGGTRTYHRMVVNIEDAGFEIRDQLQWIYGSGFPKSHDVSKGIDKMHGAEREVVGSVIHHDIRNGSLVGKTGYVEQKITTPATSDAIKWKGFGTALKPANEPIVLARKPLSESTVAKNVLKWGCGALNIDGGRIESQDQVWSVPESDKISNSLMVFDKPGAGSDSMFKNKGGRAGHTQGRWPSNCIFDEEAALMLDEQSGQLHLRGNKKETTLGGGMYGHDTFKGIGLSESGHTGASRFFYCAKASKSERNKGCENEIKEKQGARPNSSDASGKFPDHDHRVSLGNNHPTVKPVRLMEYLCKLITPPCGTILDPFMGSGTTGVAARELGLNFIGIEQNPEYCEIARKRIEACEKQLELV